MDFEVGSQAHEAEVYLGVLSEISLQEVLAWAMCYES